MDVKKCSVLAAEIRLETLKVIHSRGFGHVGGSMDLADLMAVLYGEVMKFDPRIPVGRIVTGWCSARAMPVPWLTPPSASWAIIPWRRLTP